MKNTIKCTNCGSTDFKRNVYYTEDHFEVGRLSLKGLNAYVCQKCGHVEFFDVFLDEYSKELREIEKKEKEERLKELDSKISEKENRLKSLKEIIDNLDSTQRQVQEAKKELPKLQQEIDSLKLQRKQSPN